MWDALGIQDLQHGLLCLCGRATSQAWFTDPRRNARQSVEVKDGVRQGHKLNQDFHIFGEVVASRPVIAAFLAHFVCSEEAEVTRKRNKLEPM